MSNQVGVTVFLIVCTIVSVAAFLAMGFSIKSDTTVSDLYDKLFPTSTCVSCPPKCNSISDCLILTSSYSIDTTCDFGYCGYNFAYGIFNSTKDDGTDKTCKQAIETNNGCLRVTSVADCGGYAARCAASFPCQTSL